MNTADYKDLGPVDLALDDAFRRWITKPSEEDEAFWLLFQQEYPGKKRELEKARSLIEALKIQPEGIEEQKLKIILARILEDANRQQWPGKINTRGLFRRPYYRWCLAAAATVCILIAATYLWLGHPPHETIIRSAYGEVKRTYLPDSSLVILDAHSSISFPKGKAFLRNRRILLTGEAYFEVRHDPAHPFTVRTVRGSVEDIGTTFLVRERNNEQTMQVALVSGQVAFTPGDATTGRSRKSDRLMMHPGEVYTYNSTKRELKRVPVEAGDLMGWTRNELTFRNERLRQVFAAMEQLYGYHFVVGDSSLLDHRFTGITPFDKDALLIQKIKELYDLKVVIKGDSVFLAYRKK